MDLSQMRQRCPKSSLSPFVAEARGWKLCFPRRSNRRGGGVGSITEDQSASVWGVVFSVTKEDLQRLDTFEGVPVGAYKRELIEVVDRHSKAMNVWVYKAVPQGPGDFEPHRDYIELYVRGAKHLICRRTYVKSLEELRDGAAPSPRLFDRKQRRRSQINLFRAHWCGPELEWCSLFPRSSFRMVLLGMLTSRDSKRMLSQAIVQ
jgi:hypothetical protein